MSTDLSIIRPMTPDAWRQKNPEFPWLDSDDLGFLQRILARLDVIDSDTPVTAAEKAGEGNMNLTLRVRTPNDSVIVKQSRPWVEKYPQIEAPWDRAISEKRFYQAVSRIKGVEERMPELLAFDDDARVLVLEDLGPAADFTGVYQGIPIGDDELRDLGAFAAALHTVEHRPTDDHLANRAMRKLNHQHIFVIPLQPGGVAEMGLDLDDLEPGLADAASLTQTDDRFVEIALETGDRYLSDGTRLVQGDYFPGSFLRTKTRGVFVIDPEFGYLGDPSFDLGVFIAHLALARQERVLAETFLDAYLASPDAPEVDPILLARYAGCEVVRRLIGVAQLPIEPTRYGFRADLLQAARATAISGRYGLLWS